MTITHLIRQTEIDSDQQNNADVSLLLSYVNAVYRSFRTLRSQYHIPALNLKSGKLMIY